MTGFEFGAPWGTAVKVITVLVFVIVCIPVYIFTRLPAGTAWFGLLMVAVPTLLILGCAASTIRGYQLSGHTLLIRRLGWEKRMDLIGLTSAEHDSAAMRRSLRLFGNQGFFSVTGLFWNRRLGRYRAYVMDPKRSVVLRFNERVVVVSPDDPERFVTTVRELRGV